MEIPDGTHTISVQVVDEDDVVGPAATRTFTIETEVPTVGKPILVAPDDLAFLNILAEPLVFVWDKPDTADDPTSYLIQVVEAGDPFEVPFLVINEEVAALDPTTTFPTPSGVLNHNIVYDWRVISQLEGAESVPSDPRTFTVDNVPPEKPVIALIDGKEPEVVENIRVVVEDIRDFTPEIVWTHITEDIQDGPEKGGVTYLLEIGTGAQPFEDPVFSEELTDQDFTLDTIDGVPVVRFTIPRANKLEADEPVEYSVHVKAIDRARNEGEFSVAVECTVIPAVDLVLEADRRAIRAGTNFTVTIKVEPNGQQVSAVDAPLNFDPEAMRVVSVAQGTRLEQLPAGFPREGTGTIDFSAFTLGPPPTDNFVLGVVTFEAKTPISEERVRLDTLINFNQTLPRIPRADFDGESLIGDTVDVTVAILEPVVDLRLGVHRAFGRHGDTGRSTGGRPHRHLQSGERAGRGAQTCERPAHSRRSAPG